MSYLYVLYIYLALISLVALILTLYDKSAARRRKPRVPESTLLTVAVLGGSFAMILTMCGIHHKTKHAKFMVGIPLIILIQLLTAYLIWRLSGGTL